MATVIEEYHTIHGSNAYQNNVFPLLPPRFFALRKILSIRAYLLLQYIITKGECHLTNQEIPAEVWGEELGRVASDTAVKKARTELYNLGLIDVTRIYDTSIPPRPQEKAMGTDYAKLTRATDRLMRDNEQYAAELNSLHLVPQKTGVLSTPENWGGVEYNNNNTVVKGYNSLTTLEGAENGAKNLDDEGGVLALFNLDETAHSAPPTAPLRGRARQARADTSSKSKAKLDQEKNGESKPKLDVWAMAEELAKKFGSDARVDKQWFAHAKKLLVAGYTLEDVRYLGNAWRDPQFDWYREKGMARPVNKLPNMIVLAKQIREMYQREHDQYGDPMPEPED